MEITAVCSEIHTKYINALRAQNVQFVNVKPGGTYSSHWDSEKKRAEPQVFRDFHQSLLPNSGI
jgi:hypothetical protein